MTEKECPICHRVWTPTMFDDYMLPACGHFGDDSDVRNVPCDSCGTSHAWKCIIGRDEVPRRMTVDQHGRRMGEG